MRTSRSRIFRSAFSVRREKIRAAAWQAFQQHYLDRLARIREDLAFTGQKRFAAAHELGHWTLHRGLRQEFRDDEASLADYKGSPEETQANLFASALLLPDRLARPLADRVDADRVREAAATFGVGPIAAARRLIGLAPGPAALVVANGEGRCRYYVLSPSEGLGPFAPSRAIPVGDDSERRGAGAVELAHAWWPMKSGSVRVSAIPLTPGTETLYLIRPEF